MILKIAHRGASGLKPENTLSAFKKALDFNIDMIECDVRFLKTGEAVVFHDKKLKRLTGKKGKIRNMDLKEMSKLRVKGKEKIPTLEEVLELIGRKSKINIELKDKEKAVIIAEMIKKWINKGWSYNDFLVSSFNYSALKKIRDIIPLAKLALNVSKPTFLKLRQAEKINAFSLNIRLRAASEKFIKKAQKRGFKVLVWTVNREEDMKTIKKRGADGIFTDYPHKLC